MVLIPMQINKDLCRSMQIYAGSILINKDLCRSMRIYAGSEVADLCGSMQTYADLCGSMQIKPPLILHTSV